jgi:putative membrane protein
MFFQRPIAGSTSALVLMTLLHCTSSQDSSKTAANAPDRNDSSSTPTNSVGESSPSGGSNAAANSNGSSGTGSNASPSNGTASSKTLDDAQIGAITEAANSAEVEQGRLAQSKASDSRVRSFASMMVQHHGEAQRDQAALSVGKRDNPESQQLTAQADSALKSLEQKSGAEFDRAYIQLQCDEHRKVLDSLRNDLLPNAKDQQLKAYLQQLEPKVEAHLAQAERLQKQLGSSDTQSSAEIKSNGSGSMSNR